MSFRSGLIRIGRTTLPYCRSTFGYGRWNTRVALGVVHQRTLVSHDNTTPRTIEFFTQRLKSEQLPEIHQYYPALVEGLSNARKREPHAPIQPPLTQDELLSILQLLGTSGRPSDLQLIDRILNDMSTYFNIEPKSDVYAVIVEALIRHGNIQTILRWLETMSRKPGHVTPSKQMWHMFLRHCAENGETRTMRTAMKSMRHSGCKPSNATFKILIQAYFDTSSGPTSAVPISVFSDLIDQMKQEGLRPDPSVAALLYDGFAQRGLFQTAEQAKKLYQLRFPEAPLPETRQDVVWYRRLSTRATQAGVKAALALFETLKQDGCTPSAEVMKAVLRGSRSIDDLRLSEQQLGIPVNKVHWSILIINAVRAGDVSAALSIYAEARAAAIIPDAAMVGPIIGALCHSGIAPPTSGAIDQALSLYRDLIAVSPAKEIQKKTYAEHAAGPDADIYQSLLHALSSSSNNQYITTAQSLLDDMQTRGINMGNSMVTASIILLLMKGCSNVSDAFDVYKRLRSSLHAKGFIVVLNGFSKLEFDGPTSLPPMRHYFDITRNMRDAGYPMTAEVYTIILRQLGVVVKRAKESRASLPSDFYDRLIVSVRRAHDLLTLDASVTPDAHLWNQLMDTYQHLGCFGDAYRVWDTMYLSGRFDNASVSIILDACGFAGSLFGAQQVCTRLFRDGFMFNQRNWNSWVECLCRLGRLNDAVKTVCLDMGKNQEDVAPDAKTVQILLSFARRTNQHAEVLARIRRYHSQLWESLPEELRN